MNTFLKTLMLAALLTAPSILAGNFCYDDGMGNAKCHFMTLSSCQNDARYWNKSCWRNNQAPTPPQDTYNSFGGNNQPDKKCVKNSLGWIQCN